MVRHCHLRRWSRLERCASWRALGQETPWGWDRTMFNPSPWMFQSTRQFLVFEDHVNTEGVFVKSNARRPVVAELGSHHQVAEQVDVHAAGRLVEGNAVSLPPLHSAADADVVTVF